MKKLYLFIISVIHLSVVQAQSLIYHTNMKTQAINALFIEGDKYDMNWLLDTSGKQYPQITEQYGWGLGYLTASTPTEQTQYTWTKTERSDKNTAIYRCGNISIKVQRTISGNDLLETYTFTNNGDTPVNLTDIGIYTPFNDNYPDAVTCETKRANVHIWAGGNAAYVNALRMGGKVPHLGLMLTEGQIDGYTISGRSSKGGSSNARGVIALSPSDMTLDTNESHTIAWRLFTHMGTEDFYQQILKREGTYVECDRYVVEKGKKVKATLHTGIPLENVTATCEGKSYTCKTSDGVCQTIDIKFTSPGEKLITFEYGNGQKTYAECLVVSDFEHLIDQRAHFIADHQQMNNSKDPRDGAYMVYDCDIDSIFLNDRKTVSYYDRDEGAERLGMGVFLAQFCIKTGDKKLRKSVERYATFIHEKLQDKNFNTWSTTGHEGRNRAYNYPWVATLYFYMAELTGEKKYLTYGYETLQAMFRHFNHGFYAIGIPVCQSLHLLKKAGMQKEYEQLYQDFLKIGNTYLKNGLSYPKHEVNYEQGIVAPSIIFLLQLYMVTQDKQYLQEAERQLPALDSFACKQPSFHLNDIAIRHWDGYWFGKSEMWGDVFPHYWSTLSAVAYHYYYQVTGYKNYKFKSENILHNNLCLFFENGEASCAFIYPDKVNGQKGRFYDAFANDQDWALVYYMQVCEGI